MLNDVTMVGRIEKIENNKNYCKIVLNVKRTSKNCKGEYESDMIPCYLEGDELIKKAISACKTGDLIGVKGRIEIIGKDILTVKIHRVTYLTSKKIG